MRFFITLKISPRRESAGHDPARRAALERYEGELNRAGVLLAAETLYPSEHGVMLDNRGGHVTRGDGPFLSQRGVLDRFWLVQVKSKEEAVEWAKRCPADDDDMLIELSRVTELGDFAMVADETGWREQQTAFRGGDPEGLLDTAAEPGAALAKPPRDKTLRYLMMFRADERSEAALPPTMKQITEMGQLLAAMAEAGLMPSGEGLRPSSESSRIAYQQGRRSITDGPFTETKEMVAGYVLVQVASKEEAIAWGTRGAIVNGDCVSEIRRVCEPRNDSRASW